MPGASVVMPPVVVRGLHKSYGSIKAVQDVSFEVAPGRIFGLIGPDGGGKTTIMRILVSLLTFDAGEVFFKGTAVDRDPDFVRRNVGYMPQRFSLYQDLTVDENLSFFGDLFGVKQDRLMQRRDELYAFSGLAPFSRRRAGALSGGMKQKLALSCMLIHSPEVIVLDEPTFGVDPVSRNDFWNILKNLASTGTTILVSTAYMDEALQCDEVALILDGKVLAADVPGNLKHRFGDRLYRAATDTPHLVHRVLEESRLCGENFLFGDGAHFTLAPGATVEKIEQMLSSSGTLFTGISEIEPGLEELFLKLMKETDR